MRRTIRCLGLFAATAGPVGLLGAVLAQGPPPLIRPIQILPPGNVQGQPGAPPVNVAFTLPEQRDAREQLKAVMDYLDRTTIPWEVVVGTAQRLLDAKNDSFYRIKDAKGNDTGSVVSVKAKVNQILAGLPKDGRQFYEQEYGGPATTLLQKAVDAGYDRTLLGEVSQRYFHTRAGAQGTLLLAGLDLDAGNTAVAAYGFSRLLARPDVAEVLPPRVLFKAAVSLRRAGDARQAEAAARLWDRLEKGFPRDGLAFGRKSYSLEELKAEYDRPAAKGILGDEFVTTRYGNPARAGVGAGGTPFLDPAFVKPLVFHRENTPGVAAKAGAEWVTQAVDAAVRKVDAAKKEVSLPGFFPVTAPDMVLYRAYDGVYAVASRDGVTWQGTTRTAGDLLWHSAATGGAQTLFGGRDRKTAETWWDQYWRRLAPGVLFENAAQGSLAHDGKRVYYVDDLAILPQPMLNAAGGGGNPQWPGAAAAVDGVGGMVGYNRLVALGLDTGKLEFTLGGPEKKPLTEAEEAAVTSAQTLTENSYFLGPPLAIDGKLYALYERRGQVRLGCFDTAKLDTAPGAGPSLVWSQVLGDATTPMRSDPFRRMQAAYLAYADGVMVCPTNCGVVVAVDINARSLLWARYYGSPPETKLPPDDAFGGGRFGGGRRRRIDTYGEPAPPASADRWRAAAPIMSDGRVFLAAYDSDQLQCLDVRTGQLDWSTPRESDDLYVGGVVAGRVVVVGRKTVRAYAAGGDGQGGKKLAWPPVALAGIPVGHGAAGRDGLYYVPVLGDAAGPADADPQVVAVDTATGAVKSRTGFRRKLEAGADARLALGNLVFHDGQLFSQSAVELSGFPLLEPKRRQMAERLKANPADPDGLVTRGELSLENGDLNDAIADFKAAETHAPSDAVRRRLRQKLYLAYTEVLRNKFENGESFLADYEALCDGPADAVDDAERQRQLDENVRRRRLFLELVAKGRERQGRLAEAFDYYRRYAALAGNGELVAVSDEPNGTTRPDVWARGRIEAMFQAAAPAARRPLDDKVAAAWTELKQANNLPRLRAFVGVVGVDLPAGTEARLALADRLADTNGPEDAREAEAILSRLSAATGDPGVGARVVDKLARLAVRRGAVEDAVGLYTQLATRYAAVAVRDGKTGAELFGELVTDKRLLPYLEPTQPVRGGRHTVEVTATPGIRSPVPGFTLQPEGELSPYYRRFHLGMEQAADGLWQLRVTDKETGEERCRFGGLAAFTAALNNNGTPYTLANMRLAVADGHRVVVSLGHMVYCFDLADRREAWRHDLRGKNPPPATAQAKLDPDGDIVYQYEDGWTFRLGRSVVLKPGYAGLLTRDGLKAIDPATGRELWVRTRVAATAQVFGDGRHLFVVEGNSSRVLRADDGTPVEGVKEFAPKYNTGRVGMVGRNLLGCHPAGDTRVVQLYDPLAGDFVWRREFPAAASLVRTANPAVTGVVLPDGRFEVLSTADGKTTFAGVLDAEPAASLRRPGRGGFGGYGGTILQAQPVNGAVFAFDRTTGKRLWYNADVLLSQRLLLERFDDLPVLLAAALVGEAINPQFSQYRVVALDKRTGQLRYNYPHAPSGEFLAVGFDPRTRAVEFQRADLRVRVAPDDGPAAR